MPNGLHVPTGMSIHTNAISVISIAISVIRNRNGGGVLMYISVDLNFSVLPECEGLELLSVAVGKDSYKACISLFYRPPSSSFFIFDTLCNYLESVLVPRYSNFILLGDFNVNFCNQSEHPLFVKLETLSHAFAFQQIVSEPTHVHHNGHASLIDLVFVSNPVLINSCDVIPPLCNSDHNGIFVQGSWRSSSRHNCENHSKGRTIWHYSLADWERAALLIESFDWSSLLLEDVNEAWSSWCKQFMAIMEECIPKKNLPKRKNLPWLSKRLINSIKKRNWLYKQGKRNGNLSKYRLKRNKITQELRQAKLGYFKKLNPKKPKEFWRAVKYLKKEQSTIPTLTDEDGTIAHTSSQKAEMLNTFFTKCFNSQTAPLEENTSSPNSLNENPEDLYCTEDEVCELLYHLDTSKSNGPDGISARMLKSTAASIAPSVSQLFNLSIRKGRIPNA